MEIVKGQTARSSIKVDYHKGKLDVYSISEAKLIIFRDGGTFLGRLNDGVYTLFAYCISFLTTSLTTDNNTIKNVFITLTIVSFIASLLLWYTKKNKKNELSNLYNEVVSGKI